MGEKLKESELKLYRATDEVIHYLWDPIGISEIPEARDEYYSYLPQIFAMLQANKPAIEIAVHLKWIATERMGLTDRPEKNLEVASLLIYWKEVIDKASNSV
jgi:hypothetical protein